MSEFLLYFALPVLVAIAGVSAFYAIAEGNKGHRLAEDTRTKQHPAIVPLRDAEYYMHNGHWIFGVRGEQQPEYYDHAEYGICRGECDKHGV